MYVSICLIRLDIYTEYTQRKKSLRNSRAEKSKRKFSYFQMQTIKLKVSFSSLAWMKSRSCYCITILAGESLERAWKFDKSKKRARNCPALLLHQKARRLLGNRFTGVHSPQKGNLTCFGTRSADSRLNVAKEEYVCSVYRCSITNTQTQTFKHSTHTHIYPE